MRRMWGKKIIRIETEDIQFYVLHVGVCVCRYVSNTYCMDQNSSWEANLFSAIQEIPRISWNPTDHYHIQKSQHHVPILSQLDQSINPYGTSWRFIHRPEWPSVISNWYRVGTRYFFQLKRRGRDADHPSHLVPKLKKE